MAAQGGIFIVLEGADGSGKTTQFRLLAERLKAAGYDVEVFKFPRYDKASSHFIKKYLNGEYGPADKISPYTASLFYALDRFEAAPKIKQLLSEGKVILSDRYVGSNMAHQGSKFSQAAQQRGFFVWEDSLEFQMLGIPRPTLNIFLRVPVKVSQQLMHRDSRSQRGYTDKTHDQHEADAEHLRKTTATYELLCQLFPKDFRAIESTQDGKLLPITEISDKVWAVVKPLLPEQAPNKGRSVTLSLEALSVTRASAEDAAIKKGNAGPVAPNAEQTLKLSKVSLLAQSYMAFQSGVSAKITQLGWPNDAAAFYTPRRLPGKLSKIYKASIDNLAKNYSDIEKLLKTYQQKQKVNRPEGGVLRSLLPMAALCNVELSGSSEALNRLALRMAATNQDELVWCANQIDTGLTAQDDKPAVKNIDDAGVDRRDDFITRLIKEHLPGNIAAESERVSLPEAWPRNEFELLVDSVYPLSDLPRPQIEQNIERWKYEDKKNALLESVKRGGSIILEQVHYKFDVVAEQAPLAGLLRSVGAQSLQLQSQTPRYGYEVPKLIEDAALEDDYQECFDESLRLFSALQAAELQELAPYATLMGHKLRCEFIVNGRGLFNAVSQSAAQSSPLLKEMLEKTAEVHPLIAESISAAGQSDSMAQKDARPTRRRQRRPASRRGKKS
jgi:dTMP kinase